MLFRSERSDQRFYGMQTVAKLSTEILLMKARNISFGKNDVPDNILAAEDFQDYLADTGFDDGISGFEQLDSMIGLDTIKKRIRELVVSMQAQKNLFESGSEAVAPCYHMMFTGSPGTGKTMVARIVGKIFRESGLLPVGDLLEVSRFDMVGEYIGQTGPKTVALCRSAVGSVMFIDEAYLLNAGDGYESKDFGREAMGALIAEMENNRDKFVVILAGYEDDMEDLLKTNAGLRDRIPHKIHFESYGREELFEIFKMQIKKGYSYSEEFLSTAWEYFLSLPDSFLQDKNFGNGRFVRNVVERVRIKALLRQMGEPQEGMTSLPLIPLDFTNAVADEDLVGINKKNRLSRIGFL